MPQIQIMVAPMPAPGTHKRVAEELTEKLAVASERYIKLKEFEECDYCLRNYNRQVRCGEHESVDEDDVADLDHEVAEDASQDLQSVILDWHQHLVSQLRTTFPRTVETCATVFDGLLHIRDIWTEALEGDCTGASTMVSEMKFLRTKYAQSKHDTSALANWLARAAVEHGFPISNFSPSVQHLLLGQDDPGRERTKQQLKNAANKKKQRAKRQVQAQDGGQEDVDEEEDGSGSTPQRTTTLDPPKLSMPTSATSDIPTGDYVVQAHQFIEIAKFFAEKKHFINVLREVGNILHDAREETLAKKLSKINKTRKAGTDKQDMPSQNRFGSLADFEVELEDDRSGEELSDIPLEQARREPGASVSAAKTRFAPSEAKEELLMAVIFFLADLHDIRNEEGRMFRASGGVPRLRVLRPPLLRQISSAGRKTPRLEGGADEGGRRTASVR
ncbi:hypothetical protein CF327_g5133 [Tilletia walkeri]|nr:hypothetical protein CF327_g5133 [Tilletia walkeri]